MYIRLFTLAGVTLSTICASICPMNIGTMPMDMHMDGMHTAAQEMHHDMDKQQACETCEMDSEDIAFLGLSTEIQQPTLTFDVTTFHMEVAADPIGIKPPPVFLANTGPPPLSQILVGTVILRV